MTEHEHWGPVPDCPGYVVSNQGRVAGEHRVIIRSNGAPYTAKARLLRLQRHRGRLVVFLARAGAAAGTEFFMSTNSSKPYSETRRTRHDS